MKSDGDIVEILAAYDLTGSLRTAGDLAGCSHHTVALHVAARDAGRPLGEPVRRDRVTDPFLPKIEEWVDQSRGKIRADRAHAKLLSMGYGGSERSTRRAVRQVKAAYRLGHARVHRPWITEPGAWLQYDFGDGPVIDGVKTVLFVAWLAWSRFRVVLALRDRTAPSVYAALDQTFRRIGGAPTYVLTDNEKTVTVAHIAGVPVRNQQMVGFARHYSVSLLTCQPADPASKGGSESSVKVSKADLVPKETNLRGEYASFAELEAACLDFCAMVNARTHRVTRRAPEQMLAEEVLRLHRIPDAAHTAAFGLTRQVPANTPMVTFENGQYSVPAHLLGEQVWVRSHGAGAQAQIIMVHHGLSGPVEVARHRRAVPGAPAVKDEHFPGHEPKVPGEYTAKAKTAGEAEFLAIGDGARVWLGEAAAAGTERMRQKMAAAVTLAKIAGPGEVDAALGQAAVHQRFAHDDLASLVNAGAAKTLTIHRADESRSLTQGTGAWAAFTSGAPPQTEIDTGTATGPADADADADAGDRS